MEDLKGRQLGDYQIIEQIGKGGMASVFRAYQPSLERDVAIKVLPPYYAQQDEAFTQRFKREAKAIANLRHPNILMVLEAGEQDDLAYLVMEYVNAGTLKDRLKRPISLREIYSLVKQIASALEHAHEKGIVHRDIKPSNIMLPKPDWALLTDFGLAHIVGGSFLTQSGMTVGTPAYMSPEQGRGDRVDHRTDIYSLGIMLYEMTVGEVPYTAETPMAVVVKHIVDPLPIPRDKNPDIPEELQRIILKALAKNPDDRFQTAGEFAAALERVAVLHPDWSAAEMKAVNAVRAPQIDQPETRQLDQPEVDAGIADDPTVPPAAAPVPVEKTSSGELAATISELTVADPADSQSGKVIKKKKSRWPVILGGILAMLVCGVIGLGVLSSIIKNRQSQADNNSAEINLLDSENIPAEMPPEEDLENPNAEEEIATGFDQIGKLLDEGDIPMAQEVYARLEERFPQLWELFMDRRFYPLYGSGDTEGALTLLNAGLEVNPDAPPEAYELSGFLYWELDRPMQALGAFEKTIQHHPWYAPAYYDITNLAYLYEGDLPAKAMNVMERIIEKNPTPYAHHAIGNLYFDLGDDYQAMMNYHEAKDRYREALENDASLTRWNTLGLATMLYYVDESQDEMVDMINETERLGMKELDTRVLEELGWLLIEMGDCLGVNKLMDNVENRFPDYQRHQMMKEICP
ncbi:MAG: protein kinase [Anaerolineales bacterium]|nr:protein kinase [Anaerolineales bacterium]